MTASRFDQATREATSSKLCLGIIGAVFLAVITTSAVAVEPAHREIRMSAQFGGMVPTGEWKDLVESDVGFGADLGILLARRFTAGFAFDYFDADPSSAYDPGPWIDISGNQWSLYSYEVFGEYQLSRGDLSPFVAGRVGVHFTHIDYVNWDGVETSMGDHGIGYSLASGLRYRLNQKAGLVLQGSASQTPGLSSGWRATLLMGVSAFL